MMKPHAIGLWALAAVILSLSSLSQVFADEPEYTVTEAVVDTLLEENPDWMRTWAAMFVVRPIDPSTYFTESFPLFERECKNGAFEEYSNPKNIKFPGPGTIRGGTGPAPVPGVPMSVSLRWLPEYRGNLWASEHKQAWEPYRSQNLSVSTTGPTAEAYCVRVPARMEIKLEHATGWCEKEKTTLRIPVEDARRDCLEYDQSGTNQVILSGGDEGSWSFVLIHQKLGLLPSPFYHLDYRCTGEGIRCGGDDDFFQSQSLRFFKLASPTSYDQWVKPVWWGSTEEEEKEPTLYKSTVHNSTTAQVEDVESTLTTKYHVPQSVLRAYHQSLLKYWFESLFAHMRETMFTETFGGTY